MPSVEKFIYNAIDNKTAVNYLLSYLYNLSKKYYPDVILVLTGDNDTIHQFLTLIGGIYYNCGMCSLLPEAHRLDQVDKLNGLFAHDFEICSTNITKYEAESTYGQLHNKICFFDYREDEHNIEYGHLKMMTQSSGVIIWTKTLPLIEGYDIGTYDRLRVINFTNIRDDLKLRYTNRDSFLRYTLELVELCENNYDLNVDTAYFPTAFRRINTRCLTYSNLSDRALLELLLEKLRPDDQDPHSDYFGISIPAHPKSMAKLLIDGSPIMVENFPEHFDPMAVVKKKIKQIKYIFNGWLDHKIKTNNMYNDIKWKTLETIDINVDNLLDSVELFDGFTLCSHNSSNAELYVISPIEFNVNTVKKTYELFSKLRKEGRLIDQSKVDLFVLS